MGERSRVKFIVLIALILAAAIVYSFSVSHFQDTPDVSLADPEPSQSVGPGGQDLPDSTVLVEVTPDTAQNVIRTLDRYTSYRRTVTAEYLSGGAVIGALTAEVAVDGGWTRCDVSEQGGRVEHSIVGHGTRWLWYDDSGEFAVLPAGDAAADLAQRLPTYEDVLELDRSDITAAAYEERGGLPCVYVEVYQKDLQYLERFWISVESGLLAASETEKNGETVYRMRSYEVESPLSEAGDSFTLPDGTVLHQEVAPDTVQEVIRALDRYTSYRRTVTAEYLSGGAVIGALTAEVAADGGWTRCDVTEEGGRTEHSIVGRDTRWLWYDNSREFTELPAAETAGDLAQSLPAYEAVLELDRSDITAASYEEQDGLTCVYVETYQAELRCLKRFWISVESGLLAASETEKDGEIIFRMHAREVESPLSEAGDSFTLPDGTVLHRVEA